MKELMAGFWQSCREAPRGFFAPLILLWRLLSTAGDEVLGNHN